MIDILKKIISIDSPSGYTDNAINEITKMLDGKGYIVKRTVKGALLVSACENPLTVVSAHVDTLGGMIKSINSDGTLEITQIGGYPPNSFEGEYVTILTGSSKRYTGTFLLKNPSAHVNKDVVATERKMSNMFIRLDIESNSAVKTREAGIGVGDFVMFDPRFTYLDTGFVKTRFLDDKACCSVLLDILINDVDAVKSSKTCFFFSNYEEVGHGAAAGIPESVERMIAADMGVVGDNVEGDEFSVSICAKDSNGPYDYEFRNTLKELAVKFNIPYKIDVFPYYGSDGGAALSAGYSLKVALIGPGISASHGIERTHIKGMNATRDLIKAYIRNEETDE